MDLMDRELKGLTFLVDEVVKENQRQLDKWGIQIHDCFQWVVIAGEEFGELNQAVLENYWQPDKVKPEQVVKEAIQTATLCLKIAEMYQALVEQGLPRNP